MSKKAVILIEDLYQDMEVWYPYYRLKEAGVDVKFVGTEAKKSVKGKYGYPAVTETAAEDVRGGDVDLVVIPGGWAPDKMRLSNDMCRIVKEADEAGKVIASICHGGWLLVSADVLKGKTATSYIAIKDDVVNAGAKYVDEEVRVDGNLITSRMPDDLPAFMRAILKALGA